MYVREDRETALQTDRLFELINTYIIQQKYMLPMLAFFSKSYDCHSCGNVTCSLQNRNHFDLDMGFFITLPFHKGKQTDSNTF